MNCIWRILAPYLINVRNLSYKEAFDVISNWLDKCSKLKRLEFNAKLKIKHDLDNAIKTGYNPVDVIFERLHHVRLGFIYSDRNDVNSRLW
jgi:hypothetical protein